VRLRKIIITVLGIVVIAALAVWSPWNKWNMSWLNLLGIESKEVFSGLQVTSLDGEMNVYVDEELVESVNPENSPLEITPIESGEHTVRLERVNSSGQYIDIIRKINFESAVNVVIGYEIGPTEDFSEGHIFFANKSFSANNNSVLEIVSAVENIKVSLDGIYIGNTPLKEHSLDISTKHKLKFEKEGYDQMEIEILPDSQEDRDKLKNLLLTIEINLFTRPIQLMTE